MPTAISSRLDPPALDPSRFPKLAGVERRFFDYWWTEIIRQDDPQKWRWVELEERADAVAHDYVELFASAVDLRGARVLDVGCQNGATLVEFGARGAKPTGLEIEPKCVEAARIRLACHGISADVAAGSACAMPFADGSFDAVFASNVTEHVSDAQALVREAARVLVPGGALYVDGPNRFSPRLLWSDPHFRLAGVSILPGWLASAYVTKVRGHREYGAETFPTATGMRRTLARYGLELIHPKEASAPRLPKSARRLLENLQPLFHFIAQKRAAPC